MSMMFILIPLSLVLVGFAVWAFLWAVNSGQFDDLDTPGWDILTESQADDIATPAGSTDKRASSDGL